MARRTAEDVYQAFEAHLEEELPWMGRVNTALWGDPDKPENQGAVRDVLDIKNMLTGIKDWVVWASRAVIGAVVVAVVTLIVGCVQNMPPPQQTATALNATYEAAATPNSAPTRIITDTPTPTATDIPTPTITLTSWQPVEVTAANTPAILVVGNVNEPPDPGVWYWSVGTYYSYEDWNVRGCPATTCVIVGSLDAGQTVDTVGALMDNAGSLWLCRVGRPGRDYGEDAHGAQWCNYAFLAWDAKELWHGIRGN